MVTIKSFYVSKNGEGKPSVYFDLIGDIEMLVGKSGRYYADVKRCSIPTRADEATAKLMIGRQISGSIVKKECAAFEFTIPATGEVITRTYKYDYEP